MPGRPTALVNDEGRVATTNDPSLVVGSVVADSGGDLHHLDRLPLALLVG